MAMRAVAHFDKQAMRGDWGCLAFQINVRAYTITVALSLSKGGSRFKLPAMSDWMFHCYLLLCADGSYYCGHTDDIDRRIAEHQFGSYTGYTYKRRPIRHVWSDAFQTRDDAKAAEKRIKGWSRAKKEALIAGDWERISELAKCRTQIGQNKS